LAHENAAYSGLRKVLSAELTTRLSDAASKIELVTERQFDDYLKIQVVSLQVMLEGS
jgi:hypothetical protein